MRVIKLWTPPSAKKGMRVERNQAGELYVRQPTGIDKFTTWHIDDVGEKLLAQAGVRAGQCMPTEMFQRLKAGGLLFTGAGGKRPKPLTLSPSRHPAFQLPGDTAKRRAAPPSNTSPAARPATAATDGTGAKTGRVITVMAPPVKRSTGKGGIGRPPKPKKGKNTSGEKEAKTANAPKPKPKPTRKRGSVLYPNSVNAQRL